MNYKKLKILSWNVRGLGRDGKCNVVKEIIRSSRCDICMLQETKINEFPLNYGRHFLPSYFDDTCAFNLAINTSGGVLVAWKKQFQLLRSWSSRHTVSVLLEHPNSGTIGLYTGVYGTCVDAEKPPFIEELRYLAGLVQWPWVIGGDFNLVRWLIDRAGGYGISR